MVTVAAKTIKNWQGGFRELELWVIANEAFTASDGGIVGASSLEDSSWYRRLELTGGASSLGIPAATLQPTVDALDNENASYSAYLMTPQSRLVRALVQRFTVPASGTNWVSLLGGGTPGAASYVTIESIIIPDWHGPPTVELRLFTEQLLITASGEVFVPGNHQDEKGLFYVRIPLTVAGTDVTVPEIATLEPTTTALVNSSGVLRAAIYDTSKNQYVCDFPVSAFQLPTTTPTTWADIAVYNAATAVPATPDAPVATAIDETQVDVEITLPALSVSGKLYRSVAGGAFDLLASGITEGTYEDLDIEGETAYAYKLIATNRIGDSPLSEASNTVVTPAVPPAPTLDPAVYTGVIAFCDFYQADSRTSLPNTIIGSLPWATLNGTVGTLQQKAITFSGGGPLSAGQAVVDLGVADVNVETTLKNIGGANPQGLTLRASDSSNFYIVRGFNTAIQLSKIQAGVATTQGTFAGAIAEDDRLRVECSGSTIVVKQNGVVRITATSQTFNQTATKFGILSPAPGGSSRLAALDNFKAETNSTTTDWIKITSPKSNTPFQRDGLGYADIPITGTYSGTPTAIEARWGGFGSWTTIDAAPAAGAFSGTLNDVPTGTRWLEVRFTNNTAAYTAVYDISIGDVFMVAGQSNAVGHIANPQHSGITGEGRSNVFDKTTLVWRPGYDPTSTGNLNSLADGHSIWPLVAGGLINATGVPVHFITTAVGATSSLAWTKGQSTYEAAIDTVQASGINGLKGIIFYHGETDLNDGTIGATYESRIKQMRVDIGTDLGFGSLPLLVVQVAPFHAPTTTETRSRTDAIRLAQSSAADTDANVHLIATLYDLDTTYTASSAFSTWLGGIAKSVGDTIRPRVNGTGIYYTCTVAGTTAAGTLNEPVWPTTLGATVVDGSVTWQATAYYQDGQHVITPSQGQTAAARMVRGIRNIFYDGSQGRGPQFVSATKIGTDEIDVEFTGGVGSLALGASPTVGWRVVDDTGTLTVSSAALQSSTTIRLTLNRALTTNPLISFGSYLDGIGATIRDSGTTPVPPEPFVDETVA